MLQPGLIKSLTDDELRATPVTVTGTVTVGFADEAVQIDEATGSITYVGYAVIGSATSSASWKIKRLDESGSPELIITWADGNSNYDNIWDNRASLSYS